jgi:hypothetical protein
MGDPVLAFETSTRISAPPERVWSVLTDAPRLVREGFGITRIDGAIAPGARLRLWSEVSPDRAFSIKVTTFDVARAMVWSGGMPFGLFRGVRTFSLAPEGGGTHFHMREEFSGPMLGLIAKSMPDLTPSFETFAAALKAQSEGAN